MPDWNDVIVCVILIMVLVSFYIGITEDNFASLTASIILAALLLWKDDEKRSIGGSLLKYNSEKWASRK